MSATPPTFSTVFNSSILATQVDQGCTWAQIDRGRATKYAPLMTDFFAGSGTSNEHVLAYFEASHIAEIYKLWEMRADDFPGLMEKIRESLKSGPILQDDENPASSSNRPRNDAFAFFMAGRLLAAGCDVLSVDGVNRRDETRLWQGDVTIQHQGIILDVQCKRPQSAEAVNRNVDKARKQILEAASPHAGIIAIDASVIIRPKGMLLSAQSVPSTSHKLSDLIQPHAESIAVTMTFPQIAGLIWFGRLPCMITEPSRIARPAGGHFNLTRPYTATELAVSPNRSSHYAKTLVDIGWQLKRWREVTRT